MNCIQIAFSSNNVYHSFNNYECKLLFQISYYSQSAIEYFNLLWFFATDTHHIQLSLSRNIEFLNIVMLISTFQDLNILVNSYKTTPGMT